MRHFTFAPEVGLISSKIRSNLLDSYREWSLGKNILSVSVRIKIPSLFCAAKGIQFLRESPVARISLSAPFYDP